MKAKALRIVQVPGALNPADLGATILEPKLHAELIAMVPMRTQQEGEPGRGTTAALLFDPYTEAPPLVGSPWARRARYRAHCEESAGEPAKKA